MTKVVGMDGCPAGAPNENVVKLAEELLAAAKAGQVQAAAIAMVLPEGGTKWTWNTGHGHEETLLIGAVGMMQSRIVALATVESTTFDGD
jgi:hypothetical protein